MSSTAKPIFSGSFRHTLDDKNRLTIPSAWRSLYAEEDSFLIVPLVGYLSVLPPEEAQGLRERVAAKSLADTKAQRDADFFFSKTLSFSFDKAGRVMLTPELLQHAGIGADKKVVLTASGNKFSIYSLADWERMHAAVSLQDHGDLLRSLGI
ncbi:MAG: mraZ [Verrucomicrobia bacterium]|nr:MAG: mraZ [Verrucomicrobiota bacterium]